MTEQEAGELADRIISKGFDTPFFKEGLVKVLAGNDQDSIKVYPDKNYSWYKEDMILFSHDFLRRGDKYVWEAVDLSVIRNLPIRHSVFGNVDTAELEKRMRPIPWEVDLADPVDILANSKTPGVMEALPKIQGIISEIEYLANHKDPKAVAIALALVKKFWMRGNFGKSSTARIDQLKNINARYHSFDLGNMDITLNRAYNMLWGRHVRMRQVNQGKVSFHWQLLEIPPGRQERPYTMITVPDFDLGKIVKEYRFPQLQGDGQFSAIKNLNEGNLVHVTSPHSAEIIYLEVDATEQTLTGFNRYMESVDISPFHISHNNTLGNSAGRRQIDAGKKPKGKNL